MGTQIYKYSDLIKDDSALIKKQFKALEDHLLARAKEIKKQVSLIDPSESVRIRELEKEVAKLTTKLKELNTAKASAVKASKRLTQAEANEREGARKANAERRLVAKVVQSQAGSIENLRAKLALVTNAWTKLSAAETENTKRGKRLVASKKQLTAAISQLEAKTGDASRKNRMYGASLNNLRGSLVRVGQAAGVTFGVFGAVRVFGNAIGIVRRYEKVNATLAGVLNKTKEETVALQNDSIRLGRTTVKTAEEVGKLQLAYARLGFEIPDILNLTDSTIKGSIALNASLEETALLVGAVVKSFDSLSSADTPHIVEVLAAGTTETALTFTKLETGIPIVAAAANTLGLSLEEVVSNLGVLANAGVETSTAATSFRNILIQSNKTGLTYAQALERISLSTNKLTTANELFQRRTAVSAVLLSTNREAVEELTKELEDANVVQRLVTNELDTLDGSIKLVTSAWEGYILEMNRTTSAGNGLKNVLQFLGRNLGTIINVLVTATLVWGGYRLAVFASNLQLKIAAARTTALRAATILGTSATKGATAATLAFGRSLNLTGLGVLITLLGAAAAAYYAFGDAAAAAARDRAEDFKTRGDIINRVLDEKASEKRDALNAEIKKLEEQARKAKISDPSTRGIFKAEEEQMRASTEAVNEFLVARDLALKVLEDDKVKAKNKLDSEIQVLPEALPHGTDIGGRRRAERTRLKAENDAARKRYEQELFYIKLAMEQEHDLRAEALVNLDKLYATGDTRQFEQASKRDRDRLAAKRRTEDLEALAIKNEFDRRLRQNQLKHERELEDLITGSIEFGDEEKRLQKEIAKDKARIDQEIHDEKRESLKNNTEALLAFERELIQDNIFQLKEAAMATYRGRLKDLEQFVKDETITQAKADELKKSEARKLETELTKIDLDAELERIAIKERFAMAEIDMQRSNYKSEEAFEKFKEKEITRIRIEALKERLEALRKAGRPEDRPEIAEIIGEIELLGGKIDTSNWKEYADTIRGIMSSLFDALIDKQRQLTREAEKALGRQENAVSLQTELAKNGIKNTLAFEQKELAKRESALLEQQKREQRLEKIKAVYSSYSAYAGSGNPEQALAKALRDFAILEGITASFEDGGIVGIDGYDNVITDSNGITRGQSHSVRGGILARHQGGEGFFSKKEVGNMGHTTFRAIKSMAAKGSFDTDMFGRQAAIAGGVSTNFVLGTGGSELVKEFRGVKSLLKEKLSSTVTAKNLSKTMAEIITTQNNGNHTNISRFRVKRNNG